MSLVDVLMLLMAIVGFVTMLAGLAIALNIGELLGAWVWRGWRRWRN